MLAAIRKIASDAAIRYVICARNGVLVDVTLEILVVLSC